MPAKSTAHTAPAQLPAEPAGPELKHLFDAARIRRLADDTGALCPAFDHAGFVARCLDGHDDLSLMQRLRRVAQAWHDTLPGDYRAQLAVLRGVAPRIDNAFVTVALPEFVAAYGLDDHDASMDALAYFTRFGSSEFGVRPFLRRDPARTLAVMTRWSRDADAHVRRLASEGCRPRLPWSFRLDFLIQDPSPVAPILENLRQDDSLYVRKSVANHLNDISKDHPGWVMDRLESWPREHPHTAWIARHALRTLIKQGDPRALALVGATGDARVEVTDFTLGPATLHLGDTLAFEIALRSTAGSPQTLVVDYAVHYVKKSGVLTRKVFKLKTLTLPAGGVATLSRRQVIRDFSTRVHHPGRHLVEVLVNGASVARGEFDLVR